MSAAPRALYRPKLPRSIAAVAVRDRERVVIIIDDDLTGEGTIRWAIRLAFSRMTESLGGALGLVMCEEIPVGA